MGQRHWNSSPFHSSVIFIVDSKPCSPPTELLMRTMQHICCILSLIPWIVEFVGKFWYLPQHTQKPQLRMLLILNQYHLTVFFNGAPTKTFILFYFILFYFILFYFILFYFILFYFILFYFILFYFILFYFILFYFILFYFILFYFILFYFILFYFIIFAQDYYKHEYGY